MEDLCLKFNKRYLVETKNKNYYIGEYKEHIMDSHGYVMYYILDNVTYYYTNYYNEYYNEDYPTGLRKTKPEKLKGTAFFSPRDTFYDLEEMREKGKQARRSMEQRALDMILKRLVNEHFEW